MNKIIKPLKKRSNFALKGNFFVYLVFLLFSLIFTQALRSPISGILFVFAMLFPLFILLYTFISAFAIKIFIKISHESALKYENVNYTIKLINESFLPISFVEADILLPNEFCVRCIEKRIRFSLSPMGVYNVTDDVKFSYRGNYDIGVNKIYIYDMFKMFRISFIINLSNSVFIMPRRLTLDRDIQFATSDTNTDSLKNIMGNDRSEVSDIRAYQYGDHQKSIHWKLSSKTQDLLVKQYTMNEGKNVYIFCDFSAHFDVMGDIDKYNDDINEYCIDGIIELTLAIIEREIRENNICTLIWYDKRSESGTQFYILQTLEDLDYIFKVFSTTALCTKNEAMTKLTSLVPEIQGVTMLFVTSILDGNLISDLSSIAVSYTNINSGGAMELYFFNPNLKFTDAEAQNEYFKSCKRQLEENNIQVIETKV